MYILKTYKIEITETLQRIIEIDATSEVEAYDIINNQYKNGEIVLDSSDFIDKVISILE